MKLFYSPNACSLASHIALEETGADYDAVRVDLKGGEQNGAEYRKINPKGRVPALATDRGIITENPAILAYIAQTHPEAKLAPADPFGFADMQAFNGFLSSSVHVAFAHKFRGPRYADGEAAQQAMAAKVPSMLDDYFGVIDAKLADGPWVLGESYSTADPYLYVFTRWFNLRDVGGNPQSFSHVQDHYRRMLERPAVQRTLQQEGLEADR